MIILVDMMLTSRLLKERKGLDEPWKPEDRPYETSKASAARDLADLLCLTGDTGNLPGGSLDDLTSLLGHYLSDLDAFLLDLKTGVKETLDCLGTLTETPRQQTEKTLKYTEEEEKGKDRKDVKPELTDEKRDVPDTDVFEDKVKDKNNDDQGVTYDNVGMIMLGDDRETKIKDDDDNEQKQHRYDKLVNNHLYLMEPVLHDRKLSFGIYKCVGEKTGGQGQSLTLGNI